MKKRINVSSDIESRKRIAQRRTPQPVEPVKQQHDERDKKTEAQDMPSAEVQERKSRKRKTEGDA